MKAFTIIVLQGCTRTIVMSIPQCIILKVPNTLSQREHIIMMID